MKERKATIIKKKNRKSVTIRRKVKSGQDADYFTTVGKIRGRCGHQHSTLLSAAACLALDADYCVTKSTPDELDSKGDLIIRKGVRAYSDRQILQVINGKDYPLTTEQRAVLRSSSMSDKYEEEEK